MRAEAELGFSARRRGELARIALRRCPDDAAAQRFHGETRIGLRHVSRALSRRPLAPDPHMALCAALGVCPVRLVRLDLLAKPLPPLLGPLEWRCLGFRLVLKRDVDRISVRAAADRIGISPATVTRVEQGRPMSFDVVARCAAFLALHPHELTAPATPRPRSPSNADHCFTGDMQ